MPREIKIIKMRSQGFGRKINSELGYSSFEITPATIEIEVNPPIDLATDEGKEAWTKLNGNLRKLSMKAMEEDVEFYASRNEELRITLERKKQKVENIKGLPDATT